MRGLNPIVVFIIFIGFSSSSTANTINPHNLTERVRNILSNDSYQKELVTPPKIELHRSRGQSPVSGSGTIGYSIAHLILYSGIALTLGLVSVWLIVFFHHRYQKAKETVIPNQEKGLAEHQKLSLAQIEQLSAVGRYEEAIHQLLLLTVEQLSTARNITVGESWTGRELTRILPKSDTQRSCFKHLVISVETSFFGGRTTDSKTYSSCLLAYQRLQQ
jgi:hypothetical protein